MISKQDLLEVTFNPPQSDWPAICRRPLIESGALRLQVAKIIEAVRREGDPFLLELNDKFHGTQFPLRVDEEEFKAAERFLDGSLKEAIETAAQNIGKFHEAQSGTESEVETMPGVRCWRRTVPIERVGLYIPGGSAPLFSTLLMLGVPARIAGCSEIIVCTPPLSASEAGELITKGCTIHPSISFCCALLGITTVFCVGGAQAVAALAYGTESVPKVDKIFGPGNQYVTEAKSLVSADGIAVDLPAGPSEVMVLADASASPAFIAADLLSQAEHGPDSQVMLVCTEEKIACQVQEELELQLQKLERKVIAAQALKGSKAVVFDSIDKMFDFANSYAPEHLIVAVADATSYQSRIINAGSVFLGNYTPESAGDYASGTNHTLPTNGYARAWSGVSLDSFVKRITFQEISAAGLEALGPVIEAMAEAEGLQAHRNAVRIRMRRR
ncbi:MAG: histidinol dehydrogenase [Deltaproteobacteria bacterium]|nr:histidinol dehydrogenase [Deltaproteobacteria bacterium]